MAHIIEDVPSRRTVEQAEAWAEKEIKNSRVNQLSARRIYHQREIKKIDAELESILKEDITSLEY